MMGASSPLRRHSVFQPRRCERTDRGADKREITNDNGFAIEGPAFQVAGVLTAPSLRLDKLLDRISRQRALFTSDSS